MRGWKKWGAYGMLLGICFFCGGQLAERQAVRADAPKEGKQAELALLIDDFGYHGEGTEEMLALPVPLTAAVMPFSEHSIRDAEAVRRGGKEIFIHMPMESLTGKPEWVGEKGVFRRMTDAEVRRAAEEAFAVLPDAAGMNNHMGSAIMEDRRTLSVIMEVLKEKGVMFADSMTTPKSLGRELAEKAGVPFFARSVFLDSTDDPEIVKQKLRQAADLALRDGKALAIGHVGPEGGRITAEAIRLLLPELKEKGIVFVKVSELVKGD